MARSRLRFPRAQLLVALTILAMPAGASAAGAPTLTAPAQGATIHTSIQVSFTLPTTQSSVTYSWSSPARRARR